MQKTNMYGDDNEDGEGLTAQDAGLYPVTQAGGVGKKKKKGRKRPKVIVEASAFINPDANE